MTDFNLIFCYFFSIDISSKNITKKLDEKSQRGMKKNVFVNGSHFGICFSRSPPRQLLYKVNIKVIWTLKFL